MRDIALLFCFLAATAAVQANFVYNVCRTAPLLRLLSFNTLRHALILPAPFPPSRSLNDQSSSSSRASALSEVIEARRRCRSATGSDSFFLDHRAPSFPYCNESAHT